MKYLLAFLFAISFSAAAEVPEVISSPTTFGVCKAADIATTAYIISHGIGAEANPLVASLISHGYVPLIAVSIGLYFMFRYFKEHGEQPQTDLAIGAANVVTCGVAIHNFLLIP